MSKYKGITCRGSYALGSACGHCERCADEKERMNAPKRQSYLIGYIASRVGVPSKSEQRAALIGYGVADNDIYETTKESHALDDCLDSLRSGDTLVVYTVAIFGRNRLNDVFLRANDVSAKRVQSLRPPPQSYKFGHDNMSLLSLAWEELNDISKRNIGAIGRQKGGRKPGKTWDRATVICAAHNDGMHIVELAGIHGVSSSTIRRILNEGKE